jgi:large subunit ribosomal protein L6e
MSAALEANSQHQAQTKKFGKQERTVPHQSQKASKWYPAEDQKQPKKVSILWSNGYLLGASFALAKFPSITFTSGHRCLPESYLCLSLALTYICQARKSIHPARPRPSLQPGTVVILLAGRFRGKRVILLKHLSEGTLLITGPFKINGVPLRRVNARYVIATNTKVALKGVDDKTLEKISEPNYFTKEKKSEKAKTEEAFFKQGEKPEVGFWHDGC